MTIDRMITELKKLRDHIGGDVEVPVMTTHGENDYIIPQYAVEADLEDCDGNTFKCAFIGDEGGDELTKKGIPHWEWKPIDDLVKE